MQAFLMVWMSVRRSRGVILVMGASFGGRLRGESIIPRPTISLVCGADKEDGVVGGDQVGEAGG